MQVVQTAGTLPNQGASSLPIIGCKANMVAAPSAIDADANAIIGRLDGEWLELFTG